MNNQFATQFLREEVDSDWLKNYMSKLGADEELIQFTLALIEKNLIQPERALEIMKQTLGLNEDGVAAGGSTTGGGVTNGATFTPGNGEQYAAGTKKKYQEDAPRLAGEPSKTNSRGAKNLNAYSSVGFTKAPSATEAGEHMKSIDVEDLWDEDPLYESRAYSKFKKETAVRSKPDQMHEAAKIIQNKLHEIEKLLEFTSQMRNDLSEGEQTLEYKHNTKKVFEKIHKKVVEVYTKVKGLK
jgi:hypothetical protein